ncbi:hypothetical protein [Rhizobium phage RHEph18]|uniref:hypothetical protein n=1 Tax=Rhizobium TaxID=379 RepID=UPI0007EC1B8F|nr:MULTISPECIES: hypothetical protein [Rhizobium]ANL02704.1 hypothetical protein AMJ99_CH01117 [Rhizobium esperanzae]ANM33556.1 hypothetical protein AMK04_CH01118 [Rhizobium sp. N871]QIG73706.1 hypothetical protein EVC05_014 [Rhizobium phage RHph_N2]QXV74424.1 hypothetical protein [Rhizobium phage RHEph18]
MAGLSFDDLIPEQPSGKKSSLTFDDLIASDAPAGPPKTGEELRALIYSDLQKKRDAAKPKPHAPLDTGDQKVDASTVYVDDMLFGLPGKAAAGANALIRAPFTDKSVGEEYDTIRNQYQNARKTYAEEHPDANSFASVGGALHGGVTLGRAAGEAAQAIGSRIAPGVTQAISNSYLGRMAAEGASGAAQGALSAYGHDQDIGVPALIGGVVGGAARPVTSIVGGTASAIGSMFGAGNRTRAQNAIAEALLRSGQSADDVANDLARAAQQGQPEYMVADALGNSGQRMLTGVARSPGDMRQQIAEQLQRRQAGQTDRLVNALAEGFDAPQTAAQTRTAMTNARDAAADVNYGAARNSAGVVDPTAAIGHADNFLQPGATGVMGNQTNIADDSVEALVRRARGYLTDGNSVLTDFNAAFRAKRELDRIIARNPDVRELYPIRNALDDALAAASQPYAAARDQFRRESQAIGAIDQGTAASSSRTRAADNIDQFNALEPHQQQPFRVGYVDPLIARTEAASMSPTTNKARALITGKTEQEFPAFAAPGRGDVMGERIAREQRMFETANQALGGSRTADNLADATEMMGFDPTMLGIAGNALTGNFRSAGMQALQRGVNLVQGRNQGTRDMIAQMLLQSSPTQARAELADAVRKGQTLTRAQQEIVNALIGAGSTAYSR